MGSREDPSNNCFVIDAGVRVYFDPAGDCSKANNKTMAAIKEVIGSGSLTSLDPRIVDVAYLDASDVNFDEEITNKQSRGSEGKLSGYALILLAIAVLTLIVTLIILIGRRKKQSEERKGFGAVPGEG